MSSLLTTAELAADDADFADAATPRAAPASRWRRLSLRALPWTSGLALVDQAVVSGTNFGLIWIVKRLADDAGLGRYSLGLSLLAIATVAHSSLILSPYTFFVHQIAPEGRRRLAGSVLALQVVATLCLLIVLLPAVLFAQGRFSAETAAIAWAILLALPGALLREFARKMLLAEWQSAAVLALDATISACQIGLIALVISRDAFSPAAAQLACGGAAAVVSLGWVLLARQRFAIAREQLWADWSRGIRFGAWVCADQGLMVVTALLAHWVLALLLGVEATGQFAVCLIVAQLANPILYGMGNLLEPEAARAVARGGIAELRRYATVTTWRLGGMFGALCLGFMLLGPAFIRLVFGENFDGLTITVALLALQILVFALAVGYHLALRAVLRSELNVAIGALGLVVTLAAAWAGVRAFGVPGAALALLVGNLTIWLTRWLAFSLVARQLAAEAPS